MLTSSKERKQAAADARELLRQQIKDEKRDLRDLRFMVERHTVPADKAEAFWGQLIQLQQQHGKEGHTEFWFALVPRWEQHQLSRGGALCPESLKPADAPRLTQTQLNVSAALERAAKHQLTVTADAVLQAWAIESGTV